MDFILVRDALWASEARLSLAEKCTIGVRVGSFQVLLEQLCESWLVTKRSDSWDELLQENALSMNDAFWAESIQADELATLSSLSKSLQYLLKYKPLGEALKSNHNAGNRQLRYLNDLLRLQKSIGILPEHLQLAEDWFADSHQPCIEPIHVYPTFDIDELLPWQKSILFCLESKGYLAPEPNKYTYIFPSSTVQSDGIRNLGNHLFLSNSSDPIAQDDSVQWFTCRDAAEEAEAATALVLSFMDKGVRPEDIAIVIPKGSVHNEWLKYYSTKAGVSYSNLRPADRVLDWQSALFQNLLSHLAEPTMSMGMMSVLVNPLMPWSLTTGQYFAGKYQNAQPLRSLRDDQQLMLDLLLGTEDKPLQISCSDQVITWFEGITANVVHKGIMGASKKRTQDQLNKLKRLFRMYGEDSFEQQLNKVLKQFKIGIIDIDTQRQHYLNSILVLEEGEIPPRSLEEVIVLGFNSGYYEYKFPNTGAITWQDLSSEKLRNSSAFLVNIPTPQDEQKKWQSSFLSLLRSAKQRIMFMRSLTDFEGNLLDPSETLIDMALCYCQKDKIKPEFLERSIHDNTLINWHPHIPNRSLSFKVPDQLELSLVDNLIPSYPKQTAPPRFESPSSLEKLMLSPLAWLLSRLRIDSALWETDDLSVNLAGTIAHQVFEDYAAYQDEEWYETKVRANIYSAISKHAPYLDRPVFTMAKQQLANEVMQSLSAFHEWRLQTDENGNYWRIIETEKSLAGREFGIGVRGNADAILSKGENILILDYKKSQHKGRLKQLQTGYELQTRLYRSLYRQTLEVGSEEEVTGLITSGYFALKDHVLVTDAELHDSNKVKVKSAIDMSLAEQSSNAENCVLSSIKKVNEGTITLNKSSDIKEWKDKRGLSVYTLTDNRLVQRFTADIEVEQ